MVAVIVFFGTFEYSQGVSQQKDTIAIGVVSIRKIFQECKRNVEYRKGAKEEEEKIIAELEQLKAEISAAEAGLKTLKTDSPEFVSRRKELMTKQACLQAQREFYKDQLELKDKRWTEDLYNDIIKITETVAKEKGLDVVFEKDEVILPAESTNELMLAIRTHKLIYSGGCVDISGDVMKRLDTEN
jgi:Skp family chaperone for outer membrane proteins